MTQNELANMLVSMHEELLIARAKGKEVDTIADLLSSQSWLNEHNLSTTGKVDALLRAFEALMDSNTTVEIIEE